MLQAPYGPFAFTTGQTTTDSDLKALKRPRFIENQGRLLTLLVTVTGFTAATIRPVHRMKRLPNQDEVADPPLQYQDPGQDKSVTAAGQYAFEVKCPRGMLTAIAVTAVAGAGTIDITGFYSDDI